MRYASYIIGNTHTLLDALGIEREGERREEGEREKEHMKLIK